MWLCGPGPPLLPSGLKASGVVGDYLAWGHCEGHLGSVSSEVLCWVGVGWEDPSSLKFALQNLSLTHFPSPSPDQAFNQSRDVSVFGFQGD